MITLADMRSFFCTALETRTVTQTHLREVAQELVSLYGESLGISDRERTKIITTGYIDGPDSIRCPVGSVSVNKNGELVFTISTEISADDRYFPAYIVRISLCLHEKDECIVAVVDDNPVPLLILKTVGEGRYVEAVNAIKEAVMGKIAYLG